MHRLRSPFAIVIFALAAAGGSPPIGTHLVGAEPDLLAEPDSIDRWLTVVLAAGPQATGSTAARDARDQLAEQPASALPRLFAALDSARPVAANWLRSAIQDVVDRERAKPQPDWPVASLREFVRDSKHSGRGRRLAFELLQTWDIRFRDEFLATRLDDPEFRADAVALTLKLGDEAQSADQRSQAVERYRSAFLHARESDQVLAAARKLTQAGEPVDPIRHLGFVARWHLLGPFDAPGTTGFDEAFPPEQAVAAAASGAVDLSATYSGKDNARLAWKPHATTDSLATVNLITAIAPVREAAGYAYAELTAPREQAVELRCSADDNLTVWVNGEKVLARRQWLNGTRLDRFSAPARLQAGVNRVFVKICQGPQHVNPEVPNNWTFQLRLCDATGAGAAFDVTRPSADDLSSEKKPGDAKTPSDEAPSAKPSEKGTR